MLKQTKIGATIGPASSRPEIIEEMVVSGMNFARLNFSHGTHDDHAQLISAVRSVEQKTGEPIAILQDLQGPKMRLGALPKEGVKIEAGARVVFDTALVEYGGADLPITYPGLEFFLKPGERILIDDGHMEVVIEGVTSSKITGRVVEGGTILSHKGLNLPDSTLLSIPALSTKDKEDVRFGVENGVDIISLSFAKRAEDIIELRNLIAAHQQKLETAVGQPILVIAKIERPEAISNLASILEVVDGVMVARGDLALEMPTAELAVLQKQIIAAANRAAKPVIVATQMLDSMQHNRRPTRAEVSDVSNAVIDHADALLLTNETAMGEFPALAVKTMAEIITATEQSHYDDVPLPVPHGGSTTTIAISEVSRLVGEEVGAKCILTTSRDGGAARIISQVRPAVPIMAATASDRVRRQLNISWGVYPFVLPSVETVSDFLEQSRSHIKQQNIAAAGEKIIVVACEPFNREPETNLIEVRQI